MCENIHLILLQLIIFRPNCANTLLDEANFESWSSKLGNELTQLHGITGEHILHSIYESSSFGIQKMTEEIAFSYLDDAVRIIEDIVSVKTEILHKIKNATEKAYVTKTEEQSSNCYYKAKFLTLTQPPHRNCSEKLYLPVQQSSLFGKQYVSFNHSVAHVPTNVYDSSLELNSVGNWTASLDDVFFQNALSDRTLKWQYFGSRTGFFKFYPGAMWEIQTDETKLDFFDCRSQPWYLSASSYIKKMVILVDKSGSMKGRSDIISNATVAEILNTLTDNDYFNIIMFSDSPTYADPMVNDRFIQAFKANKDRMCTKHQNFPPNGTASFDKSLTEAFELFNKTRNRNPDVEHCNTILMVITDNVPASYKNIFDKYDSQKNVRVFVYLLGQHSTAEDYVREMACENRGYAVTIATLADVKENVLKYLDVVARSNSAMDHAFITWSGASLRQFNLKEVRQQNVSHMASIMYNYGPLKAGLQQLTEIRTAPTQIETMMTWKEDEPILFTSASIAVYDKTRKAARLKQGNLVGVAGLDVPIQSFKDSLRGWIIGVNNYLFAVDNNAHVLFHPNYRPVYKSLLKGYYQNVDLNEVEIPEDVDIDPHTATPSYDTPLRESMINRERKVNSLNTHIITDNFQTVFRNSMKYFTNPVSNTPFTLGLAIRWNGETNEGYPIPVYASGELTKSKYFTLAEMESFSSSYTEDSPNCKSMDNQSSIGVTISHYEFCQFDEELASLYQTDRICALRRVLLDPELRSKLQCDQNFIDRLYTDAKLTQKIRDHWRESTRTPLAQKWGVQQAFSFHHSGLIRFYNFTTPTYGNFIGDHINSVEDPIYQETVLTSQYFGLNKIAVFHPPPNDLYRHHSSQNLKVPLPMTMTVHKGIEQVPMAVVGLQLTHSELARTFEKLVNACPTGECEHCGSPGVNCYLINQAALILVSSNGEKEVGQSLKEINCALVENLVNRSIIEQFYEHDFQAICIEITRFTTNFGTRLVAPIVRVLRTTMTFISALLSIFMWMVEGLVSIPSDKSPWNLDVNGKNDMSGKDEQLQFHNAPWYEESNRPDRNRYTLNYPFGLNPEEAPHNSESAILNSEQDFSDLKLPPLVEPTVTSERTQSRSSTPVMSEKTTTLRPEVVEEPENTIYMSNMNQDPYEAQVRALKAIEKCRNEQLTRESVLKRQENVDDTQNSTTDFHHNTTLIPGTLLDCVTNSVRGRCRTGSGTSTFTGRYACEAVCQVVRERIPQLVGKLEDCRQPLTACTERFVAFNVLPPVASTDNRGRSTNYGKNTAMKGEYCEECGTRRWWLKHITGTNLYLLIDYPEPGTATNCDCTCMKRFRYGARIKVDPSRPKPIKPKRAPPSPATCSMIEESKENYSVCTDGSHLNYSSWALLLISLTIYSSFSMYIH